VLPDGVHVKAVVEMAEDNMERMRRRILAAAQRQPGGSTASLFRSLDVSGHRQLDQAQFVASARRVLPGVVAMAGSDHALRRLFKAIDTDGIGIITARDLSAFCGSAQGPRGARHADGSFNQRASSAPPRSPSRAELPTAPARSPTLRVASSVANLGASEVVGNSGVSESAFLAAAAADGSGGGDSGGGGGSGDNAPKTRHPPLSVQSGARRDVRRERGSDQHSARHRRARNQRAPSAQSHATPHGTLQYNPAHSPKRLPRSAATASIAATAAAATAAAEGPAASASADGGADHQHSLLSVRPAAVIFRGVEPEVAQHKTVWITNNQTFAVRYSVRASPASRYQITPSALHLVPGATAPLRVRLWVRLPSQRAGGTGGLQRGPSGMAGGAITAWGRGRVVGGGGRRQAFAGTSAPNAHARDPDPDGLGSRDSIALQSEYGMSQLLIPVVWFLDGCRDGLAADMRRRAVRRRTAAAFAAWSVVAAAGAAKRARARARAALDDASRAGRRASASASLLATLSSGADLDAAVRSSASTPALCAWFTWRLVLLQLRWEQTRAGEVLASGAQLHAATDNSTDPGGTGLLRLPLPLPRQLRPGGAEPGTPSPDAAEAVPPAHNRRLFCVEPPPDVVPSAGPVPLPTASAACEARWCDWAQETRWEIGLSRLAAAVAACRATAVASALRHWARAASRLAALERQQHATKLLDDARSQIDRLSNQLSREARASAVALTGRTLRRWRMWNLAAAWGGWIAGTRSARVQEAAEKQAVAASADLAAVVAERKKVLQQAQVLHQAAAHEASSVRARGAAALLLAVISRAGLRRKARALAVLRQTALVNANKQRKTKWRLRRIALHWRHRCLAHSFRAMMLDAGCRPAAEECLQHMRVRRVAATKRMAALTIAALRRQCRAVLTRLAKGVAHAAAEEAADAARFKQLSEVAKCWRNHAATRAMRRWWLATVRQRDAAAAAVRAEATAAVAEQDQAKWAARAMRGAAARWRRPTLASGFQAWRRGANQALVLMKRVARREAVGRAFMQRASSRRRRVLLAAVWRGWREAVSVAHSALTRTDTGA
jgi:hypothetical protein